ncbi:MAG TPA: adenylate/guanylate cyclase domain-containing protein, partial [Phaeodactylibacter sp.]|nr:adenylate/guanylate cyclase domain-containing protein [Phaeodactylibacter sp.]
PVVAGVVGTKKFAYDIWGETVNIASRLEQNCEVGKVNISQSVYNEIRFLFDISPRGKIDAKNLGFIDMYYVHGVLSKNKTLPI